MAEAAEEKIHLYLTDPTFQLDPPEIEIRVSKFSTFKKVLKIYSEVSSSITEHLRIAYKTLPIPLYAPDGELMMIANTRLKDDDVLEVTHRHGQVCRFCKRKIVVKLKSDICGTVIQYKMLKTTSVSAVIEGYNKLHLSSNDKVRYKYLGTEIDMQQPNGRLTTLADLNMGDGDTIDIVRQRDFR